MVWESIFDDLGLLVLETIAQMHRKFAAYIVNDDPFLRQADFQKHGQVITMLPNVTF